MPPVAVAQPSSLPPIPSIRHLRLLLPAPLLPPVHPTPVAVHHHRPRPRWVDPKTRDEAFGKTSIPVPTPPATGVPRRSRHPAMQPGMARNIPARRACIVRFATRRLRARITWSSISVRIARIRRIWTTILGVERGPVRGLNGVHRRCSVSSITGQSVSPGVGCWMRPRDRRHIDEIWEKSGKTGSWISLLGFLISIFVFWAIDGRNWRILLLYHW